MLKSGLGLAFVSEILPDKKPVIDKFLDKYKTSQGSYVMIPIIMRYKELSLVFNKNSGDLMGTLPITLQNLLPILTKIRNTRS